MTVCELIAHLQTMPPDAVVIYRLYSEFARMEPEQITLEPDMIDHNDTIMRFNPQWWNDSLGTPPPKMTCVAFPGN